MSTADSELPGTPRVVLRSFEQFVGWGVFWTGVVGVHSLGAFLAAMVLRPELLPFMLMAMTAVVIHFVGRSARGEDENTTEMEYGELTGREMWLYTTILYSMAAVAFGGLVLWSAAVASFVMDGLGAPAAAIVVAFWYPELDRRLGNRKWWLSVVGVATFATSKVVVRLFRLRNVSIPLVEGVEQQVRTYY